MTVESVPRKKASKIVHARSKLTDNQKQAAKLFIVAILIGCILALVLECCRRGIL